MSELSEKYEDATSERLLEAINDSKSAKEKAELMGLMASKMRKEERALKDELKKETEDSKEEKRALKKTHQAVFDARKTYLEKYRDMNAIMNSKSMLKHLGDFSAAVNDFKEASDLYTQALDAHLANLAVVKRQNG
jgi:glucosamine 6-phosphate synthetase-like amidotransferase/phosphosugar isomerase protein